MVLFKVSKLFYTESCSLSLAPTSLICLSPIRLYTVENFGIHISVDGSVMYGIYVEAIMHRKDDDVSLDMLSRLLVDVHQDSSTIMNDLLSKYQKSLLDMVFMGDMDHRPKFNMIIADGIEPFLSAEEYMDRQDNENELKQVGKKTVGHYSHIALP